LTSFLGERLKRQGVKSKEEMAEKKEEEVIEVKPLMPVAR
jgi:hypothetical protein